MGTFRNRAYTMGKKWELGPQVLRTFDTEVAAGVTPRLAFLHAIGTWEVERPPPKYCADHYTFLARYLGKKKRK